MQGSTFIDPADVPFSMADPVNSGTLSGPGGIDQDKFLSSLTGPFSLTEEIIITANGAATNVFAGVNVATAPATWVMMLLGFAGICFAFRQSRRKMASTV